MRILAIVLALAVAAPVVRTAEAQRGRQGQRGGGRKERIKQRIRAMRIAVLVEELDLDEETTGKLMPILAKYDDEFTKLAQEKQDLLKAAQDATADKDDKKIDQAIDDLVKNQRARWDLDEKRFAEIRKVLTPAQAAQILVVLPEIDRRILQAARGAGRKALGGGGGAKGQDDGDF